MPSMIDVVRLFKLEQEIIKAKNQGNLALALKFYNEILLIKQEISNLLGLAKSYAEKGFLLNQFGEKNEALQSYRKAAEIAQNSKNPEFLAIITQQISVLRSQ